MQYFGVGWVASNGIMEGLEHKLFDAARLGALF
jgi:hypothetical protein